MVPTRFLPYWRALRFLSFLCAAVFVGWAILHPQIRIVPGINRSSTLVSSRNGGGGLGAGGNRSGTAVPALCNPLDPGCFIDGFASSTAQRIMNALTPVLDNFLKNPVNIVNQTPPVDSYQNTTVDALNTLFVGAIDAALACLFVVGGYTVIVGSHLSMPQASLRELLPRVVLIVGAVHFNLVFLGFFIDLENTLNLAVIHATDYQVLTNTIASLLALNPTAGLLLVILAITLGIMAVYLLVQMIARLALVDLLLVLAPLGLGCLILPQTVRWGRLWLTTFAAAVWVQFIQLVTLALGSIFLTAMTAPDTIFHGNALATALLAIGTLGLVLKIPNMLHQWALSPMWQGSQGQRDSQDESGWSGGGGSDGTGGGGDGGTIVEGTIVSEESAAAGESTILFLA